VEKSEITIVRSFILEKYISQTISTIKHRMTQHFSKSKQKCAIYFAIQKYGKDSFTIKEI